MNSPYVVFMKGGHYEEFFLEKEKDIACLHFCFRDAWLLSLKDSATFLDNTKVKVLTDGIIEILVNEFETIRLYVSLNGRKEDWCLYKKEDSLFEKSGLEITNPSFSSSFISYKDNHLRTNSKDVYINKVRKEEAELEAGDEIFFLGTKIFIYEDFIYTNGFQLNNSLQKYPIEESDFHYPTVIKENVPYHFPYEDVTFQMEEIKPFSFEYKENSEASRQLMPQLVMCLGILLTSLINIQIAKENGSSSNRLFSYLIMPISMVFSLLLWPLVMKIRSKRKEKKRQSKAVVEYLAYLDDYLDDREKQLQLFLNYLHSSFAGPKCFIHPKSIYYSTVLLGRNKIENVQSPLTRIESIDNKLKEIEALYDTELPYLLRISDYQNIHLKVKKSEKMTWFMKLIHELSFRHSPLDLKIAVYSPKKEGFLTILSLPHLFHKGFRMTYSNTETLKKMDDFVFDSEVVLIALDCFDFTFQNKRIHTVFLTDEDILSADLKIDLTFKKGINLNTHEQFSMAPVFYPDTPVSSILLSDSKQKRYQSLDYLKWDKDTIRKNYESNEGLSACFGVLESGEPFKLDLHESKDGPHGLIGGTTGSGKSEFLISLLLSLSLSYSPKDLQMIIVDYKGGGIRESLSLEGKTIPHIIASLSNIDDSSFERLLLRVSFLLKRRQKDFLELSKQTGKPISNIDDYRKYRPMANLLFVVDEFAELKKNHPEKMKELISFSRIGRSLGLHLLLLTQYPSLSIDEEIIGNCASRICLKVASMQDSRGVLGSNEACELSLPGEFIIHSPVGKRKGRAFFTKEDVLNQNRKVSLLDENLNVTKTKEIISPHSKTLLELALKNIFEVVDEMKLTYEPFEFERSPALDTETLKKKYFYEGNDLILGETDDYRNDQKELLVHFLNESAVFLSSDSSFLGNIVNSLICEDFFLIAEKKKNIGRTISYDEEEDLEYLFHHLLQRKEKCYLLIENLGELLGRFPWTFEILKTLMKEKRGQVITFVFTRKEETSNRLLPYFEKKYSLCVSDEKKTSEFFLTRPVMSNDSYFYKDRLIPFVPALPQSPNSRRRHESFIARIPEIIRKEKGLIGYEYSERKKIFIKEKETICFVCRDKEEMNQLQYFYGNESCDFVLLDEIEALKKMDGIITMVMDEKLFPIPRHFVRKQGCALFYFHEQLMNIRLVNCE